MENAQGPVENHAGMINDLASRHEPGQQHQCDIIEKDHGPVGDEAMANNYPAAIGDDTLNSPSRADPVSGAEPIPKGYPSQSLLPAPPIVAVRNVQPQSRATRHAEVYREDLEKMRLRQRREGYYQHEESTITPTPDALGYITEAQRFITDAAAVDKAEREAMLSRKDQITHAKRVALAEREEKRWRAMEEEHIQEQRRQEEMRNRGLSSKANRTSMPYNPVSLEYGAGPEGDVLRYSDESIRYRSALRASHLQERQSSRYNPITGLEQTRVQVPERPCPPPSLHANGSPAR